VNKMATRKKKLEFTIRRFKGFLDEFKRSKKGIAGLVILVIWVIIALTAPLLTPYDPIRPRRDVGLYPAFGPNGGPKIAEALCVPSWYKYLPWVYKGYVQRQEQFHNVVIKIPGVKQEQQFFGPVGKNATDSHIFLSNPCVNVTKIEVQMTNGTKRALTKTEWKWDELLSRQISITTIFPNETIFIVHYYSGQDIVENKVLISDFKFTSSSSLNEWDYNGSEIATLTYNENGGTENGGCMELEFHKSGKVHILHFFNYSALVPPKSFMAHVSIKVIEAPCNVSIVFYRISPSGEMSKPFYLFKREIKPGGFTSELIMSSSDEVRELVGLAYHVNYYVYPQDLIFRYPGEYAFGMEVSSQGNSSVYIDDFNCILYGNAFGLLGTDNAPDYPRDLFSALVYGSRVSLIVGILSAIFSTLIGLVAGLVSGYVGGFVDEIIMRVADLLLVLPGLPLFIVLASVMKSTYGLVSIWNIIIILSLLGWMGFARTVRSMVLSIRERAFIEAARAAGASTSYIIFRHVVPNVFALVYITLATAVPGAIITEASLSWLGLGDPMVPSWGKTLYDFNTSGIAVSRGLSDYWFWVFPPCIAIMLLSISFILIGFALDEILNPRLRLRR